MKIAAFGFFLLILFAVAANANPVSDKIPVVGMRIDYYCMPTQIVEEQMKLNTMLITKTIDNGAHGTYQKWSGEQNGKKVWLLMLKAHNGFTCKLDEGSE